MRYVHGITYFQDGALTVSKDGGQIDAITASTITSRAFLKAVNAAYAAFSGQSVDGTTGATQNATSQVVVSYFQACKRARKKELLYPLFKKKNYWKMSIKR